MLSCISDAEAAGSPPWTGVSSLSERTEALELYLAAACHLPVFGSWPHLPLPVSWSVLAWCVPGDWWLHRAQCVWVHKGGTQ